jgi:hypothetical protein
VGDPLSGTPAPEGCEPLFREVAIAAVNSSVIVAFFATIVFWVCGGWSLNNLILKIVSSIWGISVFFAPLLVP